MKHIHTEKLVVYDVCTIVRPRTRRNTHCLTISSVWTRVFDDFCLLGWGSGQSWIHFTQILLIHNLIVHLLRRCDLSQCYIIKDFLFFGSHLSTSFFFRFIPHTMYVHAKGLLAECIAALTLSTTDP